MTDNQLDLIGREVGLYRPTTVGRLSTGKIIAVLPDGRVIIRKAKWFGKEQDPLIARLDETGNGTGWRLDQ